MIYNPLHYLVDIITSLLGMATILDFIIALSWYYSKVNEYQEESAGFAERVFLGKFAGVCQYYYNLLVPSYQLNKSNKSDKSTRETTLQNINDNFLDNY